MREIQLLHKKRFGYTSDNSVDEVFARAFSKYVGGIRFEKSLEKLFSQMKYKGKSLRD